MAARHFDVVVIGGGIAGSCAALTLAQAGAGVALLEAGVLPRHKVCGEFLSAETSSVFARLQLEASIRQVARPVHRARIVGPGSSMLEIPVAGGGGAMALSRYRLDHLLWEAAAGAGVTCRLQSRVRTVTSTGGKFVIEGEPRLTARCVINAAGRGAASFVTTGTDRRSRAAPVRYFGMKSHFRGVRLEPGVVELHPWRGGYCGLVGIEDGVANVCLLARYELLQRLPQSSLPLFWEWLLTACPPLAGRMNGAEQDTPWISTGNVRFGEFAPADGAMLRCGDAGGHIHPLAGDGMAMAARAGEMAATATLEVLRGAATAEQAAQAYAREWRHEFGRRLRWARLLQPLMTNPALTRTALLLLDKAPGLAQRVVRATRGA